MQMLLPGIAMLIAIGGLSDQLWSYLPEGTPHALIAITILVMLVIFVRAFQSTTIRPPGCIHILFDNQGTWYQSLMPENLTLDAPWQLTTQSRVMPLGLFLVLTDGAGQRHRQWILKGELPDSDYRRVVRAISMVQR